MEFYHWGLVILVAALFLYLFSSYLTFKRNIDKLVKKRVIRFNLSKHKTHEKLYRAYKLMKPEELMYARREVNSHYFNTPILQIADLLIKLSFTVGLAAISVLATSAASILDFLNNSDKIIVDSNFNPAEHLVGIVNVMTKVAATSNVILWSGLTVFIIISSHLFFLHLKKELQKRHLDAINEIMEERKNNLYYQ